MMKSIILLLAIVVVANAYTQVEYQTTFTAWMIKNQRSYTAVDFVKRFKAFRANMDFVRDWNAGQSSTVVGLNNMADLTNEEYRSIYLGTKINFGNGEEENNVAPVVENKPHTGADNYTLLVDWRAKSAVTAIKDQGQCGSCWAFSSTGSIEGAWFLAKGKLDSLSEQNLMDCSTAQGNEACNGGLMDQAFDYIISSKGVDTEVTYPYTAKSGTCKFTIANVGATISSYKDIPTKDEAALAAAVSRQPVSVAIDASHISFQLYVSGVYNPTLLGKVTCSQDNLDHGVLAVGYGVENGVTNFWVVKNSWGLTWGQAGYIYMSKDKNNQCGIATAASYPIV